MAINRRGFLRAMALMATGVVLWGCGSLEEERSKEQTALSGGRSALLRSPSAIFTATRAPSQTVPPASSPTKTLTPLPSTIATRRPTATWTPNGRGVPWNAPTATPTLKRPFAKVAETYEAMGVTVTMNIPPDAQDLSLSCESSAAKMAAQYFKPNPPAGFTDWEWYFIKTIPRHCNPHRGYRGKIDGTVSVGCADPNGYGTYAEPVAEALTNAGVPASVEYGVDYQRIAREVRRNHPVIVWVSGRPDAPTYEVDPETQAEYMLLLGEHVWLVIGVSADNKSFLVNDPAGGLQYWVYAFPRWDVFRGMSVVVGV